MAKYCAKWGIRVELSVRKLGISNPFQKLDRFLRIDTLERTSDQLRARAVYIIAMALVASQLVNMVIMSVTYARWTFDHGISLAAAVLVAGSVVALRYCKAFYLYAIFYSLLLFGAIFAASALDFTGINSALLPFLIFGTVVCGFVSGWRMVVVYSVVAMACIWSLYYISCTAPQGALFDPNLFGERNFQIIGFEKGFHLFLIADHIIEFVFDQV